MRGSSERDGGTDRLVRPFVIRIDDGAEAPSLDLVSLVAATRLPGPQDAVDPERETILVLCERPQSVAELAAHMGLPLSVVKLLAAGMVADGSLRLRPAEAGDALTGASLLHAVLDGLRAL